jgi:catechol 2,3-dioxygenase-like lactoylglutathione lyase family enzyme/DNA-binding transcriptional ArsR family regulator
MHPFTVVADPVRRRIVELLAGGERTAGEVVQAVGGEFGIGQSAVSQQLRLLRDHGFARVRAAGARRIYALEPAAVGAMDAWIRAVSGFWSDRLDDLAAELERRPATLAPARSPAAEASSTIGGIASVTRTVGDLDASVAFYRDALGLRPVSASASHAAFDVAGTRLLLVRHAPPVPPESALAFAVDDLVSSVARLRAAGVAVRTPAPDQDVAGEERIAYFDDPDGRPLALVVR